MSRMWTGARRATLWLVVPLTLTGCTAIKAVWAPRVMQSEAEHAVHQAETLGQSGHPAEAQDLYLQVVRNYPADPARAEALYRLGVLQADPASPLRDYRAARATFTQLLVEYPRSRWDAEARAWQATLTDLLVREDEARRASERKQRSDDERQRAKTNLDRLKQTDPDLKRPR